MADEIELSKKTAKGAQAQALLDNELLKETFKYLEDEYTAAWLRTGLNESEGRERLWQAVHIVRKTQEHLQKYVIDGRIAHRDLAAIKTIKRA